MEENRQAKEGWVYFIQAEGLPRIKIGFTVDIKKRLRDLQGGCPVPLIVMKHVRATYKIEQTLLALFDTYRIQGEWFNADPALISFIDRLVDGSDFSLSQIFLAK